MSAPAIPAGTPAAVDPAAASMEERALLPCPFCGGPAEHVGIWGSGYVECGSCLATMPEHDPDVPNQVARWNTRAREIAHPPQSAASAVDAAFKRGDRVEKIGGASWRGVVVGEYATTLTPEGYAVESENEPGSVQVYPVRALRFAPPQSEEVKP